MRSLVALVVALCAVGCVLPDADFDGDGWDALDGDCDDGDPSVHPEAADPLDDGVDQDCDGIDAVMQARGRSHDCVLDATGAVSCEGDNDRHQLELPDATDDHDFVQIAAGWWHTCALDVDGFVLCWGDDRFGQASPPPQLRFRSIDADANYSIGVTQLGFGVCWGRCLDVK